MIKNLLRDKKMMFIIGGCLIITIIILVLIKVFSGYNVIGGLSNPDGEKIKYEYEKLNGTKDSDGNTYIDVSISSVNIFKYSSVYDIIKIFKNRDNAVIFFGNDKDAYSRSAFEVLSKVSLTTELDRIYYVNTRKEDNKYDELFNIIGDNFNSDSKVITPLVLFVVNGKIVSYNKDTIYSQNDPYVKLNDEQKASLGRIYLSGINDVLSRVSD